MYRPQIYPKNPRIHTPIDPRQSSSRSYIPPKSTSPFPLPTNNTGAKSREFKGLLSKFIPNDKRDVPIIYAFYEVDKTDEGFFGLGIEFFELKEEGFVPYRTQSLEGQLMLDRCEELSISELCQILEINRIDSIYTGILPSRGKFYNKSREENITGLEIDELERYESDVSLTEPLSTEQIREFRRLGINVTNLQLLPDTSNRRYLH